MLEMNPSRFTKILAFKYKLHFHDFSPLIFWFPIPVQYFIPNISQKSSSSLFHYILSFHNTSSIWHIAKIPNSLTPQSTQSFIKNITTDDPADISLLTQTAEDWHTVDISTRKTVDDEKL